MRTVGGLSDTEIDKEMALLNRSVDFYIKTGVMDIAYDGYFFRDALNVTPSPRNPLSLFSPSSHPHLLTLSRPLTR